jgi:hypothetical protein
MEKFIEDIRNNYRKLERELVTQLSYQVEHDVTTGTNREEIWVDFFKRIIPKKFNIARSVFIIDSNRECSKEVDIAIYDEQYTPYIFNYGNIKFIPLEAVAAVVQCKSKSIDSTNLLKWTESIMKLKTSQDSIVRLATNIHIGIQKDEHDSDRKTEYGIKDFHVGAQKNEQWKPIQIATTPIKILCHISDEKTTSEGSEGKKAFDIIVEAYQKEKSKEESNYSGNLNITFKDSNLYDVLCKYNRNNEEYVASKSNIHEKLKERKISDYVVKYDNEEYALLSFIFQFNQMLMMINNPMFFPHMAYVDMFNEKKRGDNE